MNISPIMNDILGCVCLMNDQSDCSWNCITKPKERPRRPCDQRVQLQTAATSPVSLDQQAWEWMETWEAANPTRNLEAIEARSDGSIQLWWQRQ